MTHYRVFGIALRYEDGEEVKLGNRVMEVTPEDVADYCHGGPGVQEVIAEWLYQREGDMGVEKVTFDYREVKADRLVGVETMTLYTRSREYGGPEEGGWWYDLDRPIRTFHVEKRRAFRLRQKLELWCAARNEGKRRYDEDRYVVLSGPAMRPRRQHYC